MKNIAIVENDEYSITQLSELLNQWSRIELIPISLSVFHSGNKILEQYASYKMNYDIIFVDIELDDMNGLEAMRRLRSAGLNASIIVTTYHQTISYIQQSFDLSAMQYFVKPITFEDIKSCMKKALHCKNIIIEYGKEHVLMPCDAILYFENDRNYIKMRCLSPNFIPKPFRSTIARLASTLPPSFVQNHRSYIVNISHVVSLQKKLLHMRNGIDLPMGKSYVDNVFRAFQRRR